MSLQDWIFSIHLLFAATLVGSLVMSWIVIVALRSVDDAGSTISLGQMSMIGVVATTLGLLGTISLGLYLAILRPQFAPEDGWVIAAIVLWTIATAALVGSFAAQRKPSSKARELIAAGVTGPSKELLAYNRATAGLVLRAVASLTIVVIVIIMLYKPGA